jgi:glycosyltransferase involved in cell wall biosynthesis
VPVFNPVMPVKSNIKAIKRMKIVYFNYLYDSDQDSVGASVHVRQFVEAAGTCGCEVKPYNLNPAHLSATRNTRSNKVRAYLKSKLRRYLSQINQLLNNGPLFFRELKILTFEKPDALLIRYNMLNFTAPLAAKLKGIPVVLEVNSPHAFERKNLVRDIWQLPVVPFFLEWLNMKLSDRIITVSAELKKYIAGKRIDIAKISVVPNGVNTVNFSPDVASNGIVEQYDLSRKTVLGFVGSFHYWHGMENILKLIDATLRQRHDIVYLLVGDGPLKADVEAVVTENNYQNRVVLTGYVPHAQVPEFVAAMDIVLAPYPAMDFFYFSPLKLFEYMSAGKAVVASSIGQISELIKDGENGLLYDPDDFQSFCRKTEQLIDDVELRRRVGKNGRETILTDYTWEKNAGRINHVISEVLAVKPAYELSGATV